MGRDSFYIVKYPAYCFVFNFSREDRSRTCIQGLEVSNPPSLYGYHSATSLCTGLSPSVTIRILRINLDLLPKSFSSYLLGLLKWLSPLAVRTGTIHASFTYFLFGRTVHILISNCSNHLSYLTMLHPTLAW